MKVVDSYISKWTARFNELPAGASCQDIKEFISDLRNISQALVFHQALAELTSLASDSEGTSINLPAVQSEDISEDPYITVTSGMSGFFAVHVWWNPDGFWEPYDTGLGRYQTFEDAELEAISWSTDLGIKYVKPAGRAARN